MPEQAQLEDSLIDEMDINEFFTDVVEGLTSSPKTLPCKYFYDERGSELFGKICDTPEYYITRTEVALLRQIAPEISEMLGAGCSLLELGSGLGIKIRILLDALDNVQSYTPMDISEEVLLHSANVLRAEYPSLRVQPWVGDYTRDLDFKLERVEDSAKPVVFFPGSTISNFGVDTVKKAERINAAYNDKAGHTAAFNTNLLVRMRDELNIEISPDDFRHHAFFNEDMSRIEMHLVSKRAQTIHIQGKAISFLEGESIHTENSCKYRIEDFHHLAKSAGFRANKTWQDDDSLFSFHYLVAE